MGKSNKQKAALRVRQKLVERARNPSKTKQIDNLNKKLDSLVYITDPYTGEKRLKPMYEPPTES